MCGELNLDAGGNGDSEQAAGTRTDGVGAM
jgi:hypothetical protein